MTKIPKRNGGGAQKAHIEYILKQFQSAYNISYTKEHKFHPTRKWRFDYALESINIAIEYEGIYASKSRHTTFAGYSADVEKYNNAVLLGWSVLRYTANNYKSITQDLTAIAERLKLSSKKKDN